MTQSHPIGRIVAHDKAVSIIFRFTFVSIGMMAFGFMGGMLGFDRSIGQFFVLGIPGTIGGLGALLLVAPMQGFGRAALWERALSLAVMLTGSIALAVSIGACAAVLQRTF